MIKYLFIKGSERNSPDCLCGVRMCHSAAEIKYSNTDLTPSLYLVKQRKEIIGYI